MSKPVSGHHCQNVSCIANSFSCFQHSDSQKPYKVWSSDRQTRKSITASNLNEFKRRGADKLGYQQFTNLRVVLESDGTEVEDDAYFQSAEKDTVFLLLRDNETWLPPGIDALKSGERCFDQLTRCSPV